LICSLKIDESLPILIAGPTASGKSSLALAIARKTGGTIINADALQVYSNWRVLTARPSAADTASHPHALYGHIDKTLSYSVGHWLREIERYIVNNTSPPPIIVGGTGLYFTSLTNGLASIPDVKTAIRTSAQDVWSKEGLGPLLHDLEKHDPATFARIDKRNPARVLRAWEVLQSTGHGLADWQDATPPPMLPLTKTNAFVLEAPKEWLTPRIAQRFRYMIDHGALDECRENMAGWQPDLPSSKAIGAPEIMAYLSGKMSLNQSVEAAEITTRQYAKRQRSWFRARMKNWNWVDASTIPCG
jgi:tRNA dimethylallyltransferase